MQYPVARISVPRLSVFGLRCSLLVNLIAVKFPKESASAQVRLGGNLNLVRMLYMFILIFAISVTANFDDTCTLTSDLECRGQEDEYTSIYSKGKAIAHRFLLRLGSECKSRISTNFST
jgi:hypothetical protein